MTVARSQHSLQAQGVIGVVYGMGRQTVVRLIRLLLLGALTAIVLHRLPREWMTRGAIPGPFTPGSR